MDEPRNCTERCYLFPIEKRSMQRFIPCPKCSTYLVRHRDHAGQLVSCSVCGRHFVMPFESSPSISPLLLMPWHSQQTPHPLESVRLTSDNFHGG